MSVNLEHTVDVQNKTSILVTLQQFLPKLNPQTMLNLTKFIFPILQDLLVNQENEMVKFSYKNLHICT